MCWRSLWIISSVHIELGKPGYGFRSHRFLHLYLDCKTGGGYPDFAITEYENCCSFVKFAGLLTFAILAYKGVYLYAVIAFLSSL